MAQVALVDDPTKFLVVDDSGIPGWVKSKYFDTFNAPRPWPLSSDWATLAEHEDDYWWRLCVAHRRLIPLMDRLCEASIIGDDDLVEAIRGALRAESARDSIISHLYQYLSGQLGWEEVSSWAQETLEESSPKAFYVFTNDQIEVLAEVSAMSGPPADPNGFADTTISRV